MDQDETQEGRQAPSALSAFVKGGLLGGLGTQAGIIGIRAFGGPEGELRARRAAASLMRTLRDAGASYLRAPALPGGEATTGRGRAAQAPAPSEAPGTAPETTR